MTLADGAQYAGDLKDGKPHGQGQCSWPDGSTYEGEWRAGVMHGKGEKSTCALFPILVLPWISKLCVPPSG